MATLEDGQQVPKIRFGTEFLDQPNVGFNPVVLTDEWVMRKCQPLVNVDRVERIGDHARNVTRSPLVIVGHTRHRSRAATEGRGDGSAEFPLAVSPSLRSVSAGIRGSWFWMRCLRVHCAYSHRVR